VTTDLDAATFDVDAFARGFTPATFTVTLFRRGDLIPKLAELAEKVRAAEPSEETSFGDDAEYVRLVAEHNAMAEELSASGEKFEFLPMDKRLAQRAGEKAKADGVNSEDLNALGWYAVAETCISHPGITGKAFLAIQERIGDFAMASFDQAWAQGQQVGGQLTAPFSPSALPTPDTGE
jgi:hypothetical protein